MRKILLSLILATCPFLPARPGIPANPPEDPLDSFKGICMDAREAIRNEDADVMLECKNRISKLNIADFTPGFFTTVKPDPEEPLDGHTIFKESYFLDMLKTGFGKKGRVRSDIHTASRGDDEAYTVLITHHMLPASGEGEYVSMGCDRMRFVIVTERPCPISVSLWCPESGVSYDFTDSDGTGVFDYSWALGSKPEKIDLTIWNHSAASVSFVLASLE
ncbi:MAG: hypothetical protein K6A62_03935 [Bacteroidales bacterium]|nr:hypothetical protein [Bacteroidales bacterium]